MSSNSQYNTWVPGTDNREQTNHRVLSVTTVRYMYVCMMYVLEGKQLTTLYSYLLFSRDRFIACGAAPLLPFIRNILEQQQPRRSELQLLGLEQNKHDSSTLWPKVVLGGHSEGAC